MLILHCLTCAATPRRNQGVSQSVKVGAKPAGQSFADWLATQQAQEAAGSDTASNANEDFFEQVQHDGAMANICVQLM